MPGDSVHDAPIATTRTVKEESLPLHIGGWGGVVVALGRFLSGLTTERALIYFLCVFIGFYVWTDRQDRKENVAAERRSKEDIAEKDRLSYELRDKQNRETSESRANMILTHCTEENRKFRDDLRQEIVATRVAVQENTKVMEDLKRYLKSKEDEFPSVIAPTPRKKLTGGN